MYNGIMYLNVLIKMLFFSTFSLLHFLCFRHLPSTTPPPLPPPAPPKKDFVIVSPRTMQSSPQMV